MKSVIRNSVFETNSSSVHTVAIRGKYDGKRCAVPDIVTCHCDEYGWNGDPLDYFDSKLGYAMSMVLNTEYPDFSFKYYSKDFIIDEDTLHGLEGYKLLVDTIGCKEIKIKRNHDNFYPYGYIDHQSCENYNSLKDFLEDWNVTLDRFLFDDNVVVYISNDNI